MVIVLHACATSLVLFMDYMSFPIIEIYTEPVQFVSSPIFNWKSEISDSYAGTISIYTSTGI